METTTRTHPNYVAVWFDLAVLTAVEIGVAFLSHLPKPMLIAPLPLAVILVLAVITEYLW